MTQKSTRSEVVAYIKSVVSWNLVFACFVSSLLTFKAIRNFTYPVLDGECHGYRGVFAEHGRLQVTDPVEFGFPKSRGKIEPLLHVYSEYLALPTKKTLVQNPHLTLRLRNPSEAEKDMRDYCPSFLETFQNVKYHAYKSDIWRNCILWKMGKCIELAAGVPCNNSAPGGIYIDRDIFLVDTDILNQVVGDVLLIKDLEKCSAPVLPAPQVSNAIIAARGQKSPVLYSVMEHQKKIHKTFQSTLDFGPRAFSRTLQGSDDIGWAGTLMSLSGNGMTGLATIVHIGAEVNSIIALHEITPNRTQYRAPKPSTWI